MRGARGWLVLGLLCTAQFVLVLDVTIVAVALPSLREGLGFSAAGLQWVVSAYVLAFAGFLLLGGRAADLWGRRTAAVPAAAQGLASGLLNTAAQVGTALGLAALVTVASARAGALTPPGARPSAAAVVDGYRWAILAGLAVTLAVAVVLAASGQGIPWRRAARARGCPETGGR
jgi:MFS family permease